MTTPSAPATTVSIAAEPLDELRCRFVVERPVYPGRWFYLAAPAEAAGAPLAGRLLALPGVTAVLIAHDAVTVTRDEPKGLPLVGPAVRAIRALAGGESATARSWQGLARAVGAAIREHLASGEPAVGEPPPARMPDENELRRRVQLVLDERVNPVIAGHGGGVAIVDVRDNVLYLRMSGGCQGCGLKDMTLKHGVEAAVRDDVPEIGAIFDLTDHAAGANPWRRPARTRNR
jgi:Fe-S cluster biogenesis protein NfuA